MFGRRVRDMELLEMVDLMLSIIMKGVQLFGS
ncbi:hypothetical protein BJY24_001240 [Nocardia transvalensis]|uniref:Uncharacterized protein n=1 Tax=Nocardia transvalensis TaxID=37333 RepID=A0A7W9PAX0_9NOCA|nr:hypothetical protein [Nocardia transvalensis]